MSAVDESELEAGLTVRLDPAIIAKLGVYLVKARVGSTENLETDQPHSFLLIAREPKSKMWLCSPLFSEKGVGSEPLDDDLKTGSHTAWKNPSYISPYQQWMLSSKAISGASVSEQTQKGRRSYYAREDRAEQERLIVMHKRNDAAWRKLGAHK